ncbi:MULTISPECIES: hypothetical protein [unclassified Leifsonia]|uniref:hypothetical protein n=1 Tax=unclassified Leifsonia TaxID=2663824 RepID=UPI0006FFCC02|nr:MULTISPECIES: hypothetical protein [unclassified Leifsonia]KQX07756.1 hypothetical protein ASC59_08495 [Leifsonia sp. Root1293]KRA12038.1 hypothetical protein ASD61_08495 [Leifsonia sp. Root60]
MGIIDTLFGRKRREPAGPAPFTPKPGTDDELAVQRYEYLLRNAGPDTVEQVHSEAFAKLSYAQRDLMFDQLVARAAANDEKPVDATPGSLATAATLVETRRPGSIKRLFGNASANPLWGDPNSMFYLFVSYSIASDLSTAYFISQVASADTAAPDEMSSDASESDFFGDFGF